MAKTLMVLGVYVGVPVLGTYLLFRWARKSGDAWLERQK